MKFVVKFVYYLLIIFFIYLNIRASSYILNELITLISNIETIKSFDSGIKEKTLKADRSLRILKIKIQNIQISHNKELFYLNSSLFDDWINLNDISKIKESTRAHALSHQLKNNTNVLFNFSLLLWPLTRSFINFTIKKDNYESKKILYELIFN